MIILNCVRISERPQQPQDVNAVKFDLKSIYKVVCDFHENSNHWLNIYVAKHEKEMNVEAMMKNVERVFDMTFQTHGQTGE